MITNGSVLIVDDDPAWCFMLRRAVKDVCEVATAHSYAQAMNALQRKDFHVIVSDVRLQDDNPHNEDGIRLLVDFNQLQKPPTFCFLLSGYETGKWHVDELPRIQRFFHKGLVGYNSFDTKLFRKTIIKAIEDVNKLRSDDETQLLEKFLDTRGQLTVVLGNQYNQSGDFRGAILNIESKLDHVQQAIQHNHNEALLDRVVQLERLVEHIKHLNKVDQELIESVMGDSGFGQ